MEVAVRTDSPFAMGDVDAVALGAFEGEELGHGLQWLLDRGEARGSFRHIAQAHVESRPVIVVGLGPRAQLDAERARIAAALADARARQLGARTLGWEAPAGAGDGILSGLVEGTLLHAYRFDRYKSSGAAAGIERLIVGTDRDAAEVVRRAAIVTAAQNRARDLANTPGNDLPPAALAEYAQGLAERSDALEVTVLDGDQIREAGMGAFAAVAQGSAESARLIELRYTPGSSHGGGAADPPPLGLVGKAVTFDSGGLSLKPADRMQDMKFDMAGGAAVMLAVSALAELEAPTPLLAVVGATENLPGPSAVKPGDIVRALDGTTIEINNTDAEGRLVLADCLTYARGKGAGRLVDLATLTGAVAFALGSEYAGLLANHDELAGRVIACGEATGELVWRLPLHPRYAEMVAGRYAQLTNRTERREAQTITAAEFLHHFAGDVPWVHLDIFGAAYDVPRPYFVGKGATGFGVRLLVELGLAA